MEVQRRTDEWGRVILTPQGMFEYLMQGGDPGLLLVEDTPETQDYNAQCVRRDKLAYLFNVPAPLDVTPEAEHDLRSDQWLFPAMPEEFSIEDHILSKCKRDDERDRVETELILFKERGLYPLLIAMMQMVDMLRKHKVVWGVGRGSSVSSYCLYLLGVHKIDSLAYRLDIKDFLK